eukprot:gnl/MRDRNA2_/MRDRNA2_87835_c0_seq1.p1 gnl/MRDRNA2_/MRDRNA2_87835_c0~~gnl/MRDRNA2_/MRDRNA2_87835_c0_seq1.p1  ORF type:complete len:358 (+),score=157.55 gnl/MRDRNA2_/MRDRNA2_87835_c0_seq1:71-1144(+)
MSLAVLLCVLAPATALRGSGQKSELLTDMRPEVVSKLLGEVTNNWVMDFVHVMSNATDQTQAYSKMEKSCLTVTKSIVDGSDGDEDRVAEYMQDVCSRSSSNMCAAFAKSIDVAMIGDANFNRNSLKLANFCKDFWNKDVQSVAHNKKEQMDAEEKAAAEKQAADEKAAAEKKAADEKAAEEAAAKAAAEKKAAEEKAAADAAKASDEQRAQAEQLRGSIRAKMENLTASIEQTSASVEKTYNATEDDVQKLVDHAQKAMKLASKKEAEAVQKAKEAKEAAEKEAAEKKAQEAAAAQQKNTTNATAANDTMPAEVTDMMNVNISKAEEAAMEEGDAKADAIVAKATAKAQKNVTQKA